MEKNCKPCGMCRSWKRRTNCTDKIRKKVGRRLPPTRIIERNGRLAVEFGKTGLVTRSLWYFARGGSQDNNNVMPLPKQKRTMYTVTASIWPNSSRRGLMNGYIIQISILPLSISQYLTLIAEIPTESCQSRFYFILLCVVNLMSSMMSMSTLWLLLCYVPRPHIHFRYIFPKVGTYGFGMTEGPTSTLHNPRIWCPWLILPRIPLAKF